MNPITSTPTKKRTKAEMQEGANDAKNESRPTTMKIKETLQAKDRNVITRGGGGGARYLRTP